MAAENEKLSRVIDVTPDGGVTKTVLREGSGDVPSKHATCLVHYVGRLVESGEVFLDTKEETESQEPKRLVAGRDAVLREQGLHLAVGSMRKGELCRLRVAPQYGYGDKGSFSFPTVPPNAELEYDLELLEWEAADEGKERRLLTYEERLEAAERRRAEGNAFFKEGQLEQALTKYRLALTFLDEDLLVQLDGAYLHKAQAVRAPALLNMAACHLKAGDFHAAIINCNQALAAEPDNPKALFRRGRARHLLGQTESALQDLQQARQGAPGDAAVLQELQAVKAKLKEEQAAQGQIFKGFFKEKAGDMPALYDQEEGEEAEKGGSDDGGSWGDPPLQQQPPSTSSPPLPDEHSGAEGAGAGGESGPVGRLGFGGNTVWGATFGWLWGALHAMFPMLFRKQQQ